MTGRAAPPFRADHVGSLLRPTELLSARDDLAAGRIDAGQLAVVEDSAIRDAVKLQESVGLQSATDGEFRREQWVTAATPKITVPSPSMAHFRVDLSKSPYADAAEYRADIADVYAAEVAGLYALGCRYLQFDDTIFAFLNDPAWRANASASGIDPDRQHAINVDVINAALAAKPADLAVTVHMCRGNYQSAWFSSGGYDYVAEDAGARVEGRPQAADRRGRRVRRPGPAVHLRSVRVRLHRRGQRAHHRPAAGQARVAGRDRLRGVGLGAGGGAHRDHRPGPGDVPG